MSPTRTVIIAGFNSPEELEEYRKEVFTPEKMAEYYTIQEKNILFLVFYDVREAVKFSNAVRNDDLSISYTISRRELPKRNEECTEKNLQGSVVFWFKGIDVRIEDNFVLNFLKQYGEIKTLKASTAYQKTIEYFDIRDARKAFNTLNNSPFGTGEISCSWAWDIPAASRIEYMKLADEFIKGTSHRDGNVQTKRLKTDVFVESGTRKSMFVALFDKFIADNVMEIERMFR